MHADSIREDRHGDPSVTEERESPAAALLCRAAAVTIADIERVGGEGGSGSSSSSSSSSTERESFAVGTGAANKTVWETFVCFSLA